MSLPAKGSGSSTPRVHVLDFIRLVAMLLMVQGHTLDALVDPARMDLDSFHWQTWVNLRGLTAPMFMMVSGAATVLGIRYDLRGRLTGALLRRRVRTALMVIAIGYLLLFPANRLADLRWVPRDHWHAFFRVNILQANGVTLLLLTALLCCTRTVRRYAAWSLACGLAILLAAPLVAGVDWFRLLPEGLASYLSFQQGSLFPLFPTSAYMFLGVGLGALLLETPEPRRARTFRMACLTAGLGSLVVSVIAARVPFRVLPPGEAWRGGYAFTTCRLGFALLVFGLLGWVAEWRPALSASWAPLGRRSLFVYVGHLTLIFGTPWTPGLTGPWFHSLTVGAGCLAVILVGGLTFGAVLFWDWVRKFSAHVGTLAYVSALLVLVRVLVWGFQFRPPWPV
ncbi:MAG: heparan-alpha-glucosaminide N-acetyltransferase domain-containing protein [Holophaga sp.]|nr:heparan-alpha-glucosaminide N-acetyltransferase domain-containing protein [Holophaga sp.]